MLESGRQACVKDEQFQYPGLQSKREYLDPGELNRR